VNNGVNPKTAQRLASHSTITLTMDRYAHLRRDDLATALDSLPDLSAPIRQAALATGTNGPIHLSPDLSLSSEADKSLVQSDAVNGIAADVPQKSEKPTKTNTFSLKNGEAGSRIDPIPQCPIEALFTT
jgi:hypothetical protein